MFPTLKTFSSNFRFNKSIKNRSPSNTITITIKNREKKNPTTENNTEHDEYNNLLKIFKLKKFNTIHEGISKCLDGKWNPPLFECLPSKYYFFNNL